MPRATNGSVDEQALAEWPRIMRARRADSEQFLAVACEKHCLAVRVADDDLAVLDLGQRNAFRESGPVSFVLRP